MKNTVCSKLFFLFTPEETDPDEQKIFHEIDKNQSFSFKALVWVVISIVVGVLVGQLK